jgi:hypothetical protein
MTTQLLRGDMECVVLARSEGAALAVHTID